MQFLSNRGDVEPFYAMDILAAANHLKGQGNDVISLAVGQPSAPAPKAVLEAAHAALMDGHIGYTDSLGLKALREAIAHYYFIHHGIEIGFERIAITTGSSAAFNLAFLSYFDVGDNVAITRPGYPAYRNIMKALGINVIEIEVDKNNGGVLTVDALLEAHKRTPLKAVLFASPANPTGASLNAEQLIQIVNAASDNNIHIISDEIYHRLNYSGPDITALSYSDNVTIINSFSKYYCMTGWRIGWMVLPKNAVRSIERIAQSLYISPPELSQKAAIAAFDATEELERVKAQYQLSRDLLAYSLPRIGLSLLAPLDGAFYAYCDCSKFSNDSMTLAKKILSETFVAVTPGQDFDPIEGHRSLRFSYAGDPNRVAIALNRIEGFLNR
ncbi:aminotransferase class I/II-fold pyridoxal phosphate-dependent enzyme [Bartonella sp. HY329]|uniref:pyridoxal phosphate-dependent aminotransferase n=1 Tax=unclassified Bartonella TaxID=2645622 RepID=UPI0021C62179|nr:MULTISPECIES: aminotransferase class I/II-fold pyridoxal phosphate-dependent enzyme [unclassified Bartonella]UXM94082.1 aminotransferase class I/II-fold pyridoxal phosphate-dependent enzyme [Bartonella sp. HY329]UXN08404.1 aminotransferase class I/II-fold pyridoxal phosphate-dependent enzyme [Bartonella sp. HY328]